MSDQGPGLIAALEEAIELLSAAGEEHWRRWFDEGRSMVLAGDPNGTTHLLRAFGGMGSFNDLVLTPDNGHLGGSISVRASDDRLYDLRDMIWTACRAESDRT